MTNCAYLKDYAGFFTNHFVFITVSVKILEDTINKKWTFQLINEECADINKYTFHDHSITYPTMLECLLAVVEVVEDYKNKSKT